MWGVSTLIVGGLFGWLSPGVQHRHRVLRAGMAVGVVVALVLGGFGLWLGSPPLGIGLAPADVAASIIGMAVLFVVGVWIGDVLHRFRALEG